MIKFHPRHLTPLFYSTLLFVFFISSQLFADELVASNPSDGIPLFYWNENPWQVNFGDYLSLKIVERIVGNPVRSYKKLTPVPEKMLLALGSIFFFARTDDVIWGSGVNGKPPHNKYYYRFTNLDIRAVRGPLTRDFLVHRFSIPCPEVYGDPALLMPYLFPEFVKKKHPIYEYIIIPHYSEEALFPKNEEGTVVYPTDPWDEVVTKIIQSKFVISGSLHGIIVAEAYGIPARLLRVTEKEPLIKYQDYYAGTNRDSFHFATSIEEALMMGGEPFGFCDLEKLYNAFPFEFWEGAQFYHPDFSKKPTGENKKCSLY